MLNEFFIFFKIFAKQINYIINVIKLRKKERADGKKSAKAFNPSVLKYEKPILVQVEKAD